MLLGLFSNFVSYFPATFLSMRRAVKSMMMTPEFAERLAAVNGVVIAYKALNSGQVDKKQRWRVKVHGRERRTQMICTICGSACRDRRHLRDHFVACVGRNGNPSAACWDDFLKPDEPADVR